MSGPAPSTPPRDESVLERAGLRPLRIAKRPPCSGGCVNSGDIRGWIGLVAQRDKMGLTDHESFRRAWGVLAAMNPFPATLGRVCPHPCEDRCNRKDKDGPVAINALERFLGDWALEDGTPLPVLADPGSRTESVGVIGAGPAGLSFAYQMARRGYQVTVYEGAERAGGMLQFGIPEYRLPERILAGEIQRILDLGVELRLNTVVGRDISVAQLRQSHQVVFLGLGAGRGLRLGVPAEAGEGSWTGVEYLALVNRGEPPELGDQVVVVGGGNTAIDAARTARRAGAAVTLLYRRTRAEMPAIAAEVDEALAEGVEPVWLASPVAVLRNEAGQVRGVTVQRMELGPADASGRCRPVPVEGSEYDLPATSVIAAVSQEPDWEGLGELQPDTRWLAGGPRGGVGDGVWAGGDSLGLGLAGSAIGQGRLAAEAADARLRGVPPPELPEDPFPSKSVKPDFYPGQLPIVPPHLSAEASLAAPEAEPHGTISEEEFLHEVTRCFSCGLCYGCEQCFMFCNQEGLIREGAGAPGSYFSLRLERCQSCGKCVDLCPCGFLSPC